MKRFASTMFALALVAGAGAALADTEVNTPGAACVAASGTLSNSVDGQAANLGTGAAVAVCPIDRLLQPTESTHVSASVWVVNENPSGLCCELISKNPGGGVVTGTQACTTTVSSSYQGLAVPQITDTTTFSHFMVQCTVPGTNGGAISKLLTYRSDQD